MFARFAIFFVCVSFSQTFPLADEDFLFEVEDRFTSDNNPKSHGFSQEDIEMPRIEEGTAEITATDPKPVETNFDKIAEDSNSEDVTTDSYHNEVKTTEANNFNETNKHLFANNTSPADPIPEDIATNGQNKEVVDTNSRIKRLASSFNEHFESVLSIKNTITGSIKNITIRNKRRNVNGQTYKCKVAKDEAGTIIYNLCVWMRPAGLPGAQDDAAEVNTDFFDQV